MRVSARADYALRAVVELATVEEGTMKVEDIAASQEIPPRFLENILLALRHAGLLQSQRGADGGYRLAQPAAEISLADVIRATEGPLAAVRGVRPDDLEFEGSAEPMGEVWIAVRAALRSVLEQVSVADVARGELPAVVSRLASRRGARDPH